MNLDADGRRVAVALLTAAQADDTQTVVDLIVDNLHLSVEIILTLTGGFVGALDTLREHHAFDVDEFLQGLGIEWAGAS